METEQNNNRQLNDQLRSLVTQASEAFDNEEMKEAKDLAQQVIDLYEDAGEPEDCQQWAGFANWIVGRYYEENKYNGTMAYIHYLQAVELGCATAYTKLGQLFYEGDGVTPDGNPDVNMALEYWQKGMEEGNDDCAELYEAHKHEYLPEVQDGVEIDLPEGHHYEGEVDADGRPHGVGKMSYKKLPYKEWMDQEVAIKTYEGHFQYGLRCGYGRATFYQNGFGSPSYKGNWRDDLPDGKGRFESYGDVTSSWYEGEWKAGRRHGQGKFYKHWDKNTFPTYTYEGEWADDQEEGEGTASWASPYSYSTPSIYEGQWKAGLKHGHGKMTYVSGNTVEGEWERGRLRGTGIYTCTDGLSFSAVWNEDGMDTSTIKATSGAHFLSLRLHRSGFDYNKSAVALVQVKTGDVLFKDCIVLTGENDRVFGQDDVILTIRNIDADGSIAYTVPGLFTHDNKPLYDTLPRGETREYKDVQKHTATIYDDDYDYKTEYMMVVRNV